MKDTAAQPTFPLVCLGASAGGTEAYCELLSHLPADSGFVVVIVNHFRNAVSLLPEILPSVTTMPVHVITDGLAPKPNYIFIIPTAGEISISDGVFRVTPLSKPHGWPNVLTVFLESLTREWKGTLVGVILSGLDGDGSAALKAFKGAGGTTFAQKLDTAQQEDMPRNAMNTGYIDFELPPADIARELVRIAREIRPGAKT
ncbi:MAG: chemotaxis protein CheB [Bryobacteraceae bacterium]|nr:chemotaxis protein CheB [Bryobacteraceae bacterium]